ncbi:MAG: glutamine-hydrolyzing GMP synthase [Bryobacteraceae bacterium]
MTNYVPNPQIAILDTGGQYCHLIARKVRELGVYAEVFPSDTSANLLAGRKGLIISGGPASVYEAGSPSVDPQIFSSGQAVLGICYGQQLMARALGGTVSKGLKGEYGLAVFETAAEPGPLFRDATGTQQIWMSHRDTVSVVPSGFQVSGKTSTCSIAAIADAAKRLYGVQFHPEVVHTHYGRQILSNFLFDICGCTPDWDPKHRIPLVEQQIREVVGDRNIFFFVSGGVDSTVAYTLCLKALGKDRVRGTYVDTGLMREGETAFVRGLFESLGSEGFHVEDAAAEFLAPLREARDPEKKRHIIGEQFVHVQDRILKHLDGQWILGQGTIYPDTIESGGSAKADLIKTHHNRVAGIQKLIDEKRIVEPLAFFYKDEVREIGRELGLPQEFLDRHPFPGPGLAIRCLCSADAVPLQHLEEGWLIPVKSVGVQGDCRTYKPILAITGDNLHQRAIDLTNAMEQVNRVVSETGANFPMELLSVQPSAITPERLDRLRTADAIVRRISVESGFEKKVWQFPVVLIPVGTPGAPDSVVLRPIDSVDGMTAESVAMDPSVLTRLTAEILQVPGVAAVFYDLTHKPPGTIEWE